jgi:hypothetical protein
MYATLSYDVFTGPAPVQDVRQAVVDLFFQRETLDLLAEVLICEIDTTADYLDLVRALRQIGTDFPSQFEFVCTLHRTGDLLKSNAAFSKSKADAIIDPEG